MTETCREMERFGKGIGNTSRYIIVQALCKGHKTVGQLVKIVKLSQPAVSQHLKTLKACNLVLAARRGQEVVYSVNVGHTLKLLKSLSSEVKKTKSKK